MTLEERTCINLLRDVFRGNAPADPGLAAGEWQALFSLAERHKLLPLILDAAISLPSCRAALRAPAGAADHSGPSSPVVAADRSGPSSPVVAADRSGHAESSPDPRHCETGSQAGRGNSSPPAPAGAGSPGPSSDWRALVLEQLARQVVQENEFLNLILALRARGLEPVVVKGCVCRALYPKPLLRPSVDDDLLIPDEQSQAFHAALLELGLTADNPDADPEKAWELSYHKPDSPLYVELHKRLFDPNSDVFFSFNEPFDDAPDRSVPIQIQDVTLRTLTPTDHLLFLLLHAFKHFLHSGFGLRIVADVCLYSRHYAPEIDFDRVLRCCAARRCDRFAAALYRIGEKYLDLPAPAPFAAIEADENELLEDVLASGLHGAEIDRLHSANVTLGAVSNQLAGRASSGGLTKTLFPSAKKLAGRYPWLERRPWLLPAAWVRRTASYLRSRKRYGEQSPAASLRIGRERVRLLERYGVIDPK